MQENRRGRGAADTGTQPINIPRPAPCLLLLFERSDHNSLPFDLEQEVAQAVFLPLDPDSRKPHRPDAVRGD